MIEVWQMDYFIMHMLWTRVNTVVVSHLRLMVFHFMFRFMFLFTFDLMFYFVLLSDDRFAVSHTMIRGIFRVIIFMEFSGLNFVLVYKAKFSIGIS